MEERKKDKARPTKRVNLELHDEIDRRLLARLLQYGI